MSQRSIRYEFEYGRSPVLEKVSPLVSPDSEGNVSLLEPGTYQLDTDAATVEARTGVTLTINGDVEQLKVNGANVALNGDAEEVAVSAGMSLPRRFSRYGEDVQGVLKVKGDVHDAFVSGKAQLHSQGNVHFLEARKYEYNYYDGSRTPDVLIKGDCDILSLVNMNKKEVDVRGELGKSYDPDKLAGRIMASAYLAGVGSWGAVTAHLVKSTEGEQSIGDPATASFLLGACVVAALRGTGEALDNSRRIERLYRRLHPKINRSPSA